VFTHTVLHCFTAHLFYTFCTAVGKGPVKHPSLWARLRKVNKLPEARSEGFRVGHCFMLLGTETPFAWHREVVSHIRHSKLALFWELPFWEWVPAVYPELPLRPGMCTWSGYARCTRDGTAVTLGSGYGMYRGVRRVCTGGGVHGYRTETPRRLTPHGLLRLTA